MPSTLYTDAGNIPPTTGLASPTSTVSPLAVQALSGQPALRGSGRTATAGVAGPGGGGQEGRQGGSEGRFHGRGAGRTGGPVPTERQASLWAVWRLPRGLLVAEVT